MRSATALATPVQRKKTLVGGYALDMDSMPPRPSGRTGVSGELLKPEIADAKLEAHRLYFELQHALASIGEDLFGGRPVVADERIRAAMMRMDDMRKYVQVVAKVQLVPYQCSRCHVQRTDDKTGDRMCDACIPAAYGRSPVR